MRELCKRGHERTPENLRPNGTCRTCARLLERDRQERIAAAEGRTIRRPDPAARQENLEHARETDRLKAAKRSRIIDPDETNEYVALILGDPCVYCGGPATEADHIIPVARDGANHWSNYAPTCSRCNREKHAKSMLTYLLDRRTA